MKITKYIHSCLLLEENNLSVLIDPGSFTFEEKALDINSLQKLDYLLITHEHFDHMHIPGVKDLVSKFDQLKIISNSSVARILKKENIQVSTEENDFIKFEAVPHEGIVGMEPPENIQFNLFNRFSDPGDSHSFTHTLDILALPIQAPWGSYSKAMEIAQTLKPKVIIPVHDWHWKDEVRIQMYTRSEEYLKQFGIDFKSIETGQTVEV